MYECFDTGGEKIRRIGVASVKRVLKKLVNITDDGEDCWATVSCPDAGVFICRWYKEYTIVWFNGDKKIEEVGGPQGANIHQFLELRKDAMEAKKCLE